MPSISAARDFPQHDHGLHGFSHRGDLAPAAGAAPASHEAFGAALDAARAQNHGGAASAATTQGAPGVMLQMMQEMLQVMQQLLHAMKGGPAASGPGTPAQAQFPGSAPGQTSAQNTPAQSTPVEGGSGGGKAPQELSSLEPGIDAASKKAGVPKDLLSAVIWDESRGKAGATSTNPGNGKTDGGLMQVNPDTFGALQAKHPALSGKSLSDPNANMLAGAYLLADEKAKFGSWDLALRAYNSGEGSVDRSNANTTTTGLGDANYIQKVNQNKADIDKGAPLPS